MSFAAQHGGPAALLVLLAAIPAALLTVYLVAALHENRGRRWSSWRTLSFALGTGLILVAISPPIADWAHHDLRGHMVQHLLLGMFAPLALVLGAPVTLLLRILPAQQGRRVVRLLAVRPVRFLVHPLTAALLDIGGLYVLYLTPLFVISVTDPVVHVLVHVHFVISGYLFAWSIAGPDAAPQRPPFRARLCVLFVATAAHATLAKSMYAYGFPRGGSYGIAEYEAAAQWMYYGGDVAELLLAVAFFAAWFQARSRAPGTAGMTACSRG